MVKKVKKPLREYMGETIVITRTQYMLNFLIGIFAGCTLMFCFAMLGMT